MSLHELAGKPAPRSVLVNVPRLVSAYYVVKPDPSDPGQLERWFILHGLQGYLRLPAYPGGDALGVPANKVGGALASD